MSANPRLTTHVDYADDTRRSVASTDRDNASVASTERRRPVRTESLNRTPAQRKAKRDENLLRKKIIAATKLQAAFRGRKARRANAKTAAAQPQSLRSGLEPYMATAVATAIAVQWDDTLALRIIGDPNRESWALLNAVATTLYAALLYLLLVHVSDRANARLVNLVKQALQVLVGWMWKAVVGAVDDRLQGQHLSYLPEQGLLWALAGIMAAFALVLAPTFTGLVTLGLHPLRAVPRDTFLKQFYGLLLGASGLVIGFAWHQALARVGMAVAYGSSRSPSLPLVLALVRAAVATVVTGAIKAHTPLRDASKVPKPPKKDDTLLSSFRDRSRFVGSKSLTFICAFAWWDIVEGLVIAVGEEAEEGWGPYIVYTVFIAVFFAAAAILAVKGSSRPQCCTGARSLAAGELILYSTVAVQLGWAVKNSYQELIDQVVGEDAATVEVIYWSLGGTLMLILWLVIFFYAFFGRVQRSPAEEERTTQL